MTTGETSGLELIMQHGDDDGVTGAAVLIVILAVVVGRAAWKKPNAGARLAALLGLIIAVWMIMAVAAPTGAGTLAVDGAKGIAELAVGLGKILGTF